MQPCMTVFDFLPGFAPLVFRFSTLRELFDPYRFMPGVKVRGWKSPTVEQVPVSRTPSLAICGSHVIESTLSRRRTHYGSLLAVDA